MATVALNTNEPFLLSPAVHQPVLIGNRDLVNSVYIGPRGLFPAEGGIALDPLISEIDPQGFTVFDGETELWGLAAAGTPEITIQVGSTYWAPSAGKTDYSIGSIATFPLPILPGQTTTGINQARVTQPGFTMTISAQTGVNIGSPLLRVMIKWYDSNTNAFVAQQYYYFFAGQNGFANDFTVRGPARADTVTVQIHNMDSANAADISNFAFYTSERPYTKDYASTSFPAKYTLYTAIPGSSPSAKLLGAATETVASGTPVTLLLPFYSGRVNVLLQTSSGTSDAHVQFTVPQAINGGAITDIIQDLWTDSHGNASGYFNLPNAQCFVTLINTNAASETLNLTVESEEVA